MIAEVISLICVVVLISVSTILIVKGNQTKDTSASAIREVVDQINESQAYAYRFDKTQEQNIKNMDMNVRNIDAKATRMSQESQARDAALQKNINALDATTLKKVDITKERGVPYVRTGQLQVGSNNAFTFSNNWLNMHDPNDARLSTFGLKMGSLWTTQSSRLDGDVNTSNAYVVMRGGMSSVNPNGLPTQFPSKSDGMNYISGDTVVRGNTNNLGNMNVGSNLNVSGRIHFRDPSMSLGTNDMNNTDSYYLQKVVNGTDSSMLRLTLTDNPNESMQIANSSSTQHIFDVAGNAWHGNSVSVANGVTVRNNDPGALIEKNYRADGRTDNRFGVGQFSGGQTRVYAGSAASAGGVNLSVAKQNGQFDDVLQVKTDKTVTINGDTKIANSKLRVGVADTAQYPTGWAGGVMGMDMYSVGGTIGAGDAQGNLASYINKDGDVYGKRNVIVGGNVLFTTPNPGPMIQTDDNKATTDSKFGLGQYAGGQTRVYAAGSNLQSAVNLSIARANGNFDDIVKVKNDKTVEVNGRIVADDSISFAQRNGPLVERNYGGADNRYGFGQFDNGQARVYASGSNIQANVNLSIARPGGVFDDVLQVKSSDRSVVMNGNVNLTGASQLCMSNVCITPQNFAKLVGLAAKA